MKQKCSIKGLQQFPNICRKKIIFFSSILKIQSLNCSQSTWFRKSPSSRHFIFTIQLTHQLLQFCSCKWTKMKFCGILSLKTYFLFHISFLFNDYLLGLKDRVTDWGSQGMEAIFSLSILSLDGHNKHQWANLKPGQAASSPSPRWVAEAKDLGHFHCLSQAISKELYRKQSSQRPATHKPQSIRVARITGGSFTQHATQLIPFICLQLEMLLHTICFEHPWYFLIDHIDILPESVTDPHKDLALP